MLKSLTIGGGARFALTGTFPGVNGADQYGFVAQQISWFKLGAAKVPRTENSTDAPISVGPTGDVTICEVA